MKSRSFSRAFPLVHKIEEELRQRLARALAARALETLRAEMPPVDAPESQDAWPPLPGRAADAMSGWLGAAACLCASEAVCRRLNAPRLPLPCRDLR